MFTVQIGIHHHSATPYWMGAREDLWDLFKNIKNIARTLYAKQESVEENMMIILRRMKKEGY